jgi:prefoldin subunit 5
MSERIENLTKDAKRLRSELNQFQKAVRQLQPDQTEEGECEDILESLTGEVRNLTGQCSKVISALKI